MEKASTTTRMAGSIMVLGPPANAMVVACPSDLKGRRPAKLSVGMHPLPGGYPPGPTGK